MKPQPDSDMVNAPTPYPPSRQGAGGLCLHFQNVLRSYDYRCGAEGSRDEEIQDIHGGRSSA